jgi:polyhydroxyalkanoate synthesis regulator phasin
MRRWEMVTRWLERSLLFGLGLLTVTRERVVQFVDKLVEEGEVRAEEAPKVVERLVARGEEEREALRKMIREEMARWAPPSRQDVEDLKRRVDELAARVEELSPDPGAESGPGIGGAGLSLDSYTG